MKVLMKLRAEPFEQIKSGKKTVELRLFDKKRQGIRVGDVIEFTCGEDSVQTEVIALHRADSFKELFGMIPPESAGFNDREDYVIMRDYYSAEEEGEFGVVGIEMRLI